MMNDNINRQAVSAWLYNCGYEKLSEQILDIERFPSAKSSEYPPWTMITFRMPTNEEQELYSNLDQIAEDLPEIDEEVLVSDGKQVWLDTMLTEGNEVYWDSGWDLEGTKWMPKPQP